MTTDIDCICHGNWRLIVNRHRHLLGKKYKETRTGDEFVFFGLVLADDDYYYGMSSQENGMVLLTCVGSIEAQGFQPIQETESSSPISSESCTPVPPCKS